MTSTLTNGVITDELYLNLETVGLYLKDIANSNTLSI